MFVFVLVLVRLNVDLKFLLCACAAAVEILFRFRALISLFFIAFIIRKTFKATKEKTTQIEKLLSETATGRCFLHSDRETISNRLCGD